MFRRNLYSVNCATFEAKTSFFGILANAEPISHQPLAQEYWVPRNLDLSKWTCDWAPALHLEFEETLDSDDTTVFWLSITSRIHSWPRCESLRPPPLTRSQQGDSSHISPLAHPSGLLRLLPCSCRLLRTSRFQHQLFLRDSPHPIFHFSRLKTAKRLKLA